MGVRAPRPPGATLVTPVVALLLASVAAAGCGRKGPPLAPIVRVPAPIDDITVRRVSGDAYVTFTVPAQNVDASTPADLIRVDVFALTAPAPPARSDFLRDAARIASIPVAAAGPDEPGSAGPAAPADRPTVSQGALVTVRDLVASPAGTVQAAPGSPSTPNRYYLAVGVSDRDRSNPAGRLAAVPAGPAPEPPQTLSASHTADAIRLAWNEVPGALSYNVYRDDPLPAAAAGEAHGPGTLAPAPLNDAPISGRLFSEPLVEFGRERCYRVRSVAAPDGSAPVESDASPRACVTPEDRFPPAAPTELVAVAGPDGIAIRWAPSRDADLGGYLVLRGTPADVTLLPVTGTPVVETQYLDRDVVPGTRYVYAVVAVDSREPPNRSPESARDAATAR